MNQTKKIALLTYRYDSNYGGNLQRYALVTTLQRLGCEVTCLYIRLNWSHQGLKYWVKRTIKQIIKRYVLLRKNEPICLWKYEDKNYIKQTTVTIPFYNKYINHTPVLYGDIWLNRWVHNHDYDAFIVGSDQVWRKHYIERFGLGTYFLDFLPEDYKGKRVAYGASFGVDYEEYDRDEQELIRPLYEKFTAVSVREIGGLNLLKQYKWNTPEGKCVLDPTLLLKAEDYSKLIDAADTHTPQSKLLCYILDSNDEKNKIIEKIAGELKEEPMIIHAGVRATESIEQWLRDIRDANHIVTDSFHGVVFSLIFHKSFKVIINQARGASRFESLEKMLNISLTEEIDWAKLDMTFDKLRKQSVQFLKDALSL